jgi:hypothetical protein
VPLLVVPEHSVIVLSDHRDAVVAKTEFYIDAEVGVVVTLARFV